MYNENDKYKALGLEKLKRCRFNKKKGGILVLTLRENKCDSMTDYFDFTKSKEFRIAFMKTSRCSFKKWNKLARQWLKTSGPQAAGLSTQEIADIQAMLDDPQENRENYSMGNGMYLSRNGYSTYGGWVVERNYMDFPCHYDAALADVGRGILTLPAELDESPPSPQVPAPEPEPEPVKEQAPAFEYIERMPDNSQMLSDGRIAIYKSFLTREGMREILKHDNVDPLNQEAARQFESNMFHASLVAAKTIREPLKVERLDGGVVELKASFGSFKLMESYIEFAKKICGEDLLIETHHGARGVFLIRDDTIVGLISAKQKLNDKIVYGPWSEKASKEMLVEIEVERDDDPINSMRKKFNLD